MKLGSIGVVLGFCCGTRKLSLHSSGSPIPTNDPTAWLNRGLALSSWDDTLTRSLFDQAIHLKPDFPKAWDKRGYVLVSRDPEAIASDKALNLKQGLR